MWTIHVRFFQSPIIFTIPPTELGVWLAFRPIETAITDSASDVNDVFSLIDV